MYRIIKYCCEILIMYSQKGVLKIKCIGGNKALYMSSQLGLKSSALLCGSSECQCSKLMSDSLEIIETDIIMGEILPKMTEFNLHMHNNLQSLENKFQAMVEKLIKDREVIKAWRLTYKISQSQLILMELLKQGNFKKITSDLIAQVKLDFPKKTQKQNKQILNTKYVSRFWQQKRRECLSILNDLIEITQNSKFIKIRPYRPCPFQSKILQNSDKLDQFLQKPGIYYKLLYRASENNFSIEEFHQKCDNKEHTLILILTEKDKIIGGYTPLPWKSSISQVYEKDTEMKSFLFSITLNQKYPIITPQKAILNFRNYGPVFGQGHDIWIQDQANVKQNSFFYFPCSYNNGKYKIEQSTHQAFSGATNMPKMRLKQWEVYQVQWVNKHG